MLPGVIGLILMIASKLLLVGLLVLVHLGRLRFRSVPPPLFQRRAPVGGTTRLFEGIFGIGAGYALCAAMYFVSLASEPTGTTLALIPAESGPAERAGLLPGDLARSVEGRPVKSFDEFRQAVERGPESVSIEVERKGRVVPLSIRKNEHNRIGVAPVPGPPMGVASALPRAIAAPALFLAAWVGSFIPMVLGEQVEMAGPVVIGVAAAGGSVAWARILALLLTKDLAAVSVVYVVILVADARWRARYQAAQRTAPQP